MLLAAVLSAWLQYAANGSPHARAVVSDAACPPVVVDGRSVAMTRRAGRTAAFADVVCDAAVPAEATSVRIGTRALPRPAHDPRTIVVLGDTGCRVTLTSTQACGDPQAWAFPRIARAIAAVKPDLVIHVGDYLYRESACPPFARCAGTPHGDDAPAWYADFLTPAQPLFAAAPVLLLRGNHEECDRNGAGWFRYLDARASTACSEATPPYAVDLGGLRVVAFDSAIAEDRSVDPSRTPTYRTQFADVARLARRPAGASGGETTPGAATPSDASRADGTTTWFVTHRPPYTNDDERSAMGDALAPFDAVLSGHIHFFAALNVETLPPLVINGEGGTKLDPNYAALLGLAAGDLHVTGEIFGLARNGFGVYRRTAAGWRISVRDAGGHEGAHCTLERRTVRCASANNPS